MKKIYLFFAGVFGFYSQNYAQQTFTNFQAASIVVGQPSFTTQNTSVTQSIGNGSNNSAISSTGMLAVGSQNAGRVLLYNSVPTSNGAPANIVVGKPNFTSSVGGCTQSLCLNVDGVAFSPDGQKLIISDSGNNRVLIWNSIPTVDGQNADVVIGQTNFTSNISGVAPDKLNYPAGLLVTPDGKLIINDLFNHRVLIFNSIPTTNGASANVVIGQPNFLTNTQGNQANQLNTPWYSSLSPDGKLLISEEGNNRVLIFNSVPTTNNASANVVIGQTAFGVSTSGTSQNKFNIPIGVTCSPDGKVAVGEFLNQRVLIFNSVPTTNGANADVVLGQPSFTTSVAFNGGVSAQSMNSPYGINFDLYGRLFVNGRDMHRLMIYGTVPTQTAELSIDMTASNASSLCLGSQISYTVNVANNGPSTASNVIANTSLPALFTLSNYNASAGTYTASSGIWSIPSLPSGSVATMVLNGNVSVLNTMTLSAYTNLVNSQQFDSNLLNNATSATVAVTSATAPSGGTLTVPSSVCEGTTFTVSVNGVNNATNYSWSASNATITGSGTLVSVTFGPANTNINVLPTNSACIGSNLTSSVLVNAAPVLTTSTAPSTICAGSTSTLSVSGASSYTWSTSSNSTSIVVNPSVTTQYTVVGTNTANCNATSLVNLVVNALPNVSAVSSASVLCTGSTATLTASGATTYTWDTSTNGNVILVSPSTTTAYVVSGTDANGCSNSFTVTQTVSACTGINESAQTVVTMKVYPNPSNGQIEISSDNQISVIEIYNLSGKLMFMDSNISKYTSSLNISGLDNSVYLLRVKDVTGRVFNSRIVIQK